MTGSTSTLIRPLLAATVLASLALPAAAQDMRIRGTVTGLDGQTLDVTARGGEKQAILLAPDLVVTALVVAKLSDVKPGSYVGSAAIPQPDGSLKALELQVFPEAMRGVGEGSRPFDLTPQSTMTNGTVGDVVGGASGPDGRTLTVQYKGGEKRLVVPPDVPVVTYLPGDRKELTPGAHVIVQASRGADGVVSSKRVQVGRDGLVPPM